MFDSVNVNLRKNEGFVTSIPCIPIPKYGQSNAPLVAIVEGEASERNLLVLEKKEDPTKSTSLLLLIYLQSNQFCGG